ncbi:hypothetical protein LISE100100_00295 [Listeria seeligeri]
MWDNANECARSEQDLFYLDSDGELTNMYFGSMPNTYFFEGIPPYYSYSALIPVGDKKNPFEFMYYRFDEDEGQGDGWISTEVMFPLKWQTEKEFLQKVIKEMSC